MSPGHALARIGSTMSDRQLDIVKSNITDADMELEVSRLVPSWYQEWYLQFSSHDSKIANHGLMSTGTRHIITPITTNIFFPWPHITEDNHWIPAYWKNQVLINPEYRIQSRNMSSITSEVGEFWRRCFKNHIPSPETINGQLAPCLGVHQCWVQEALFCL